MISAQLFKQLQMLRKLQRKIELLGPVVDEACKETERLAVAFEKAERTQEKRK